MSLMLHAGAAAIDRAALATLPLPQARGSRHVVRPFIEDVELIDGFLRNEGYVIADEAFGVKTGKDDMPTQFFREHRHRGRGQGAAQKGSASADS